MILDERSTFSDDQAITASAASTNYYDFGAPGTTYDGVTLQRNLGKAQKAPLMIQVTEDFNNLTSLTIDIETDDNTGFASAKKVASVVVLLADLVEGYQLPIDKLPRGIKERYMRLYYTVTGTAPTTGKVAAGFVASVDGQYLD